MVSILNRQELAAMRSNRTGGFDRATDRDDDYQGRPTVVYAVPQGQLRGPRMPPASAQAYSGSYGGYSSPSHRRGGPYGAAPQQRYPGGSEVPPGRIMRDMDGRVHHAPVYADSYDHDEYPPYGGGSGVRYSRNGVGYGHEQQQHMPVRRIPSTSSSTSASPPRPGPGGARNLRDGYAHPIMPSRSYSSASTSSSSPRTSPSRRFGQGPPPPQAHDQDEDHHGPPPIVRSVFRGSGMPPPQDLPSGPPNDFIRRHGSTPYDHHRHPELPPQEQWRGDIVPAYSQSYDYDNAPPGRSGPRRESYDNSGPYYDRAPHPRSGEDYHSRLPYDSYEGDGPHRNFRPPRSSLDHDDDPQYRRRKQREAHPAVHQRLLHHPPQPPSSPSVKERDEDANVSSQTQLRGSPPPVHITSSSPVQDKTMETIQSKADELPKKPELALVRRGPTPSSSQVPPPMASNADDAANLGCTCKKSKCLKLYCQCFAGSIMCGPSCRCLECMNTPQHEQARKEAIRSILSRNPGAFETKFKPTAPLGAGAADDSTKVAHKLGCKCRKSACLKKYCECFHADVKCSTNCRCVGCQNMPPGGRDNSRRTGELFPARSFASDVVTAKNDRAKHVEPHWMVDAAQNLTFLKNASSGRPESQKVSSGSIHNVTHVPSLVSFDGSGASHDDDAKKEAQAAMQAKPDESSSAAGEGTSKTSKKEGNVVNTLLMAAYAMTELHNKGSPPQTPTKDVLARGSPVDNSERHPSEQIRKDNPAASTVVTPTQRAREGYLKRKSSFEKTGDAKGRGVSTTVLSFGDHLKKKSRLSVGENIQ